MVKKGEIAVAQMFSMFQGHPWLFFKVKMLEKALKNFSSWFPEIEVEDERASLVHEMIRLEMVVTTVHYAEVFAANLLAFKKKRKRFHKTLLSYRVSEVTDFYKKIKRRKLPYIASLLGYPALFQVPDEKQRELLMKSCKKVQEKLSEIADYYLTHLQLYNAYKHGFRIGVLQQAPPPEIAPPDFEPFAFIMQPLNKNKLNRVKFQRIGKVEKEVELCNFMVNVLTAVTETFSQRVLEKKETFTALSLE